MYLMIDNYDSFVYNLKAYFEELGREIVVKRSDQITVDEIEKMQPQGIILSPGPKRPWDAEVCVQTVERLQGKIPILGVCLGHQTIGQVFGGRVVHARNLMHGKTSPVTHDGKGLFEGIPQNFKAMRYHSLAVEAATLPDCLQISARSDDGEIMAMRHREFPIESIQYHPESIVTVTGKRQLGNFLRLMKQFNGGKR